MTSVTHCFMFIFIVTRYLPFRREAVLFVTIPTDDKQHHTASYIYTKKRMKQILTLLLLSIALTSHAGEIVVHEGESIHDALRQAREWRRTNDPRCKGGITITLKAWSLFYARAVVPAPRGQRHEGVTTRHPRYWREAHKCHLWRCPTTSHPGVAVKRTR